MDTFFSQYYVTNHFTLCHFVIYNRRVEFIRLIEQERERKKKNV